MKQEFPKGVEVAQVQGTPLSNRRRTRKRNGTTASKVRHIATCHESLSRIGHVHPQASEGVLGALRANAKIRSGNSTRFTPNEVNDLRKVGLDLADVKCQNDIDPV